MVVSEIQEGARLSTNFMHVVKLKTRKFNDKKIKTFRVSYGIQDWVADVAASYSPKPTGSQDVSGEL